MKLKGSIRSGAVSGGRGGYATIEVEDEASGIRFLEIKLSYEQFGKLIGSNGTVECEYEVRGLENLGKKYEHKPGSIKMPGKVYRRLTDSVKWDEKKEPLRKWIEENAKEEGWNISAYLGSRDSIIGSGYGDQDVTLNFSYYRYV